MDYIDSVTSLCKKTKSDKKNKKTLTIIQNLLPVLLKAMLSMFLFPEHK